MNLLIVFIQRIIFREKETYDMFKRVKQFYKRLKIEQHRNGQM